LASYRAFERMPEVANAAAVSVESLETFLQAEENTIEALLASQEAWARAKLDKYPARPAELAFKADPARSDESRRSAFLMALRVAPDSRFALYYQQDPCNPLPGTSLPHSAVNTLPESAAAEQQFAALRPGELVMPLVVLATASDEADYGLDTKLWEDSASAWGRVYGFGVQPFGNSAMPYATQAPFHLGFMHESQLVTLAAPFIQRSYVRLRSQQYATLAALAFRTGHAYWGWRFVGLSLHYLQELTQPYHASLAPGQSGVKLLAANTLALAGMPGMRDDLVTLLSNRHLVLEKYQLELLLQNCANRQDTALEVALHNSDKDKTYPEWSDSYLRDVVSLQASQTAAALDRSLIATMPPAYVSNSGFDFGQRKASIALLAEMTRREAGERLSLDLLLAELMANFGAHSRNAVRGILRASSPP
jgi:hypothetical protein